MLKSIWSRVSERISSTGGVLPDPDLATQKTILIWLSLSAIPIGLIWTPIEFAMGDTKNGLVTAAIAALIVVNFLFYIYRKDYEWFRFSQLLIFLSFPFALHLAVGGFTKSANLMWGLATPLIALLSSRLRDGTPWFLAYIGLVILSGIMEPFAFPESGLSISAAIYEFGFNIINISLIVYLMLVYFVNRKNQAYKLLAEEEEKAERLLLNVLPAEIAPALKTGNKTIADRFQEASILFADIVGFTQLSARMAPEEMVDLLNQIFSHFDSLVEKYGLEKIRTIGDNYMVASGVPRPRPDHAQAIARLALDIRDYIEALPLQNSHKIQFRVGINSGTVVAGVIGRHRFHYDLWGDPVNTASRMESHGVPGQIQMTSMTRELIKSEFVTKSRGMIDIKGIGKMETWFLTGVRQDEVVDMETVENVVANQAYPLSLSEAKLLDAT